MKKKTSKKSFFTVSGKSGIKDSFRKEIFAPVAQLDRALVYGTKGYRFDSCQARFISVKRVERSPAYKVRRIARTL